MTDTRVPFLSFADAHGELADEFRAVFDNALATGRFIGGPVVADFEQDFARFCRTPFAVGVGSGTDAVRFALIACGVQNGDMVITVPNTFIATSEAISQAGALPAFVDVDERTYNMDPEALRRFIEHECVRTGTTLTHTATERRVSAVVPVHLYGQPADMDAIGAIAEEFGLKVVEDACQAHGARHRSAPGNTWRRAGALGHAAAFSFYPGKNLGALGEGGAVTTSDEAVAETVRKLRDHGQGRKYYHDMEGYNGRLDAIQAGFLQAKLKRLEDWNTRRRECAARYRELLGESPGLTLPFVPEWAEPVFHLYEVQVAERDAIMEHLTSRGVGCGLHYPVPLHLQRAYADRGYGEGSFAVAEKLAKRLLSLPMSAELTEEQQQYVAGSLLEFSPKETPA